MVTHCMAVTFGQSFISVVGLKQLNFVPAIVVVVVVVDMNIMVLSVVGVILRRYTYK